jgi:hypothetical protein
MQMNEKRLSTVRQLKMARGIAHGMDYLSTIGFVHRVSYHCTDSAEHFKLYVHGGCYNPQNLAARNVLVSRNEVCKVTEFQLAGETVDGVYEVNKVRHLMQ